MEQEKDSILDISAQNGESVPDGLPQEEDCAPDDTPTALERRIAENERLISILKKSISSRGHTACFFFFGALVSGIITYAIIASDGFFAGFWLFIALCCIGIFLYELVKITVDRHELRTRELKIKTPEERKRYHRRRKIRGAFGVLLLTAACAAAIAFAVHQRQATIAVYEQAEALIDAGSFEQAAELLKQIEEKDYQDTKALLMLCEAHKDFAKEYYVSAHNKLKKASFQYQTDERLAVIRAFCEEVEAQYTQQLIENEARRKQNEEEKRRKEAEEAQRKKKEMDAWVPIPVPGGSGSKSKSSYDEYYADEFADAEDFYDWYAEDFDSYEDAEDYYYSHID